MLASPSVPTTTSRYGRLFRSGVVGIVATLIDLLALSALVEGFGLDPVIANVPALSAGLLVQFLGNKFWAFLEPSTDVASLSRQAGLFALVEVGAFALNAAAFHLLVTALAAPYPVARIVGSCAVYFAFSYPLWRFVFRAPDAEPNRSETGGKS